jgi:beta-lactamase regulating signal transducer with metallopeptidase domain
LFYPLGNVNDYKLMQMKKVDPVWKFFLAYMAGVALLILLAMLFSSCKLTRDVSKNSTDSSSVKTDRTEYSRTDSSRNTKEKDSDRITFVYPVDTTVNNYYTYPSTVIYEKIKEKQEDKSFDYESFRRELLDSVNKKEEVKQVASKAGTDPLTIGLIVFAGILALGIIKKLGIL